MNRLEVLSPEGAPEVRPGDDLADLAARLVELRDGDVLTVTSKVVSKAEGLVGPGDRSAALASETVRVVARRGPTVVVRNLLGLTMAAAGIDASNVEAGHHALLPRDPDASARRIRERLARTSEVNVAVIVTDTAGRAWRHGQTDLAIGAAGLVVAEDHAGRRDAYGNELAVTLPAVADEIAGAAQLAQGKLAGRPFAVLRGRADLVLPRDLHGPGAASLVREEGSDLFGYGSREAVVRALSGAVSDRAPFGSAASTDELQEALTSVLGPTVSVTHGGGSLRLRADAAVAREVVAALCFAHGWEIASWRTAGHPEGRTSGTLAPVPPATT